MQSKEASPTNGSEALVAGHETLKAIRNRGSASPAHLEVLAYLRALEAELDAVRRNLDEAWTRVDTSRDFRKCSLHLDHAQQRLHKVVKRLSKKPGTPVV